MKNVVQFSLMVKKNRILGFTRERLESKLGNYNAAVQIQGMPAFLALCRVLIFPI